MGNPDGTEAGSDRIQSTELSLAALRAIGSMNGARLSTIAEEIDSHPSTLHSHLKTLRSQQFIVKDGDEYQLGPQLLQLGQGIRYQKKAYAVAENFVTDLFNESGYRTVFGTEFGGRCVFLHIKSASSRYQHEGIGETVYMHNTAVGKAILSKLEDQRIKEIIDRWGLPRETKKTITDRSQLWNEIDRIREKGYVVNPEENRDGTFAIGAAARSPDMGVIGGFSLSGPETLVPQSDGGGSLPEILVKHVDEFELEASFE
jgi:DNA-binding IclR family transcriptional regulator